MKLDSDTLENLPFALRVEIDENAQRKPLTQSELALQQRLVLRELRKHKTPGQRTDLKAGTSGKSFPEVRATDIVGKLFNESRKQVEKRLAVFEAAEQDPARFGHLVEEMDRTGNVTRAHLAVTLQRIDDEKTAKFQKLAKIDSRLNVGDFRKLAHVIPDESVKLVFTDPCYGRESIPLYEDAAREAARILKPGGSMICYVGHVILPEVLPLMMRHLRYFWIGADVHDGGPLARMNKYGIIVGHIPLLWLVKGHRGDDQKVINDTVFTPREKDVHEWQKSIATARHFIEGLTSPNGVVVDFFAGGGTTIVAAQELGRPWIAFEIDETAVPAIMDRIQAPLQAAE
jgi:SAM-dependent methyltransferase